MPAPPNIITRDTFTNQQTAPPNNTAQGWGYWASMAAAPSAELYGVGPAWIAGVLYWSDGSEWYALNDRSTVFVDVTGTSADVTAINSAITALNAAGGGTIYLSEGNIPVGATPITLKSGVSIIGKPPLLTLTGDAPDLGFTISGGTVFVGDGTNKALVANNTALGSPPTPGSSGGIAGVTIKNLAFNNFLYGIDVGARNQVGLTFTEMSGLIFKTIENTAIRLYNAQHINANYIKIFDSAGKGLHLLNAHPSASCGNSVWSDLYVYPRNASTTAEGIVLETDSVPAGGVSLNQILFLRPQVNAFGRTAKTGSPHVRMTGTSGRPISNIRFLHGDFEGAADSVISLSYTAQCVFDISQMPNIANFNYGATCANAQTTFNCSTGDFNTNLDAASARSMIMGSRKITGMAGRQGFGFMDLPEVGSVAIGMAPADAATSLIKGLVYSLRGFIAATVALGKTIYTRDATISLNGTHSGLIVFNGATGQTFTLPTIDDTNYASTYIGCVFDVLNVSANTLTVVTNGTQTINNQAGKTQITLAAGQVAHICGAKTNSGTLFWACTYTNGTIGP